MRELIHQTKPAYVLIEGPFDYNDRIKELALPHELPIALYTYVVNSDGSRKDAFYPFCIYSPEWQAAQAGFSVGAEVRFIDLPWADMVEEEEVGHRYSDHELRRSDYVKQLCSNMGVESFDDVWDELVEIAGETQLDTYLERAGTLCQHLRAFDQIRPSDERREDFMAGQIRRALNANRGEIVVVTGGYHTPALEAQIASKSEEIPEASKPKLGGGRGIALTPYSYQALDQLTGYEAGLPNPGFYHQVWTDGEKSRENSHLSLLFDVALQLRRVGQTASAADLIAVEATARALSTLRGHARVWRKDLIDGILGALVKEELSQGLSHPMLDECYRVFRGGARGRLAEGVSLPALVLELKKKLAEQELEATERPRTVKLDLYDNHDLARSRLLNACRVLSINGFQRDTDAGVLSTTASSELFERWRIKWSEEFEASAIRASTYGPSILQATAARLLEQTHDAERNAARAAELLFDSALAGIEHIAGMLAIRVETLVKEDGDLANVAKALGKLLYLYRYDTVLRTVGRTDVGGLLLLAYERASGLLDSLSEGDSAEVDAVSTVLETYERCGAQLDLDQSNLIGLLERSVHDDNKSAMVRGAAAGALWTLGQIEDDDLLQNLSYFSEPDVLGDFLAGLFKLAKEVVQRRPEVVVAINGAIEALSQRDFLIALPGLRLAFSQFTPREKMHVAERVLQAFGQEKAAASVAITMSRLHVSSETATEMMAFEAELGEKLTRYSIRGRPGSKA